MNHLLQKKSIHDLTAGSIPLVLLFFTFPLLLTQLVQQLFSVIDGMLIGHYVGAGALAAIGIASLFLSILLNFCIGLSTGISVLTAHYFGARQDHLLKQSISTALLLSLLIGALLTVFGESITPFYLVALKTPQAVVAGASLYLRICCLGIIPQIIFQTGNAILRSLGNTQSPLIQLGVSLLLNLLLDLLFILIWGLGIAGAGLATLLSQWFLAGLMLYKLGHLVPDCSFSIRKSMIARSLITRMLRIGLPSGMQALFMSLSSLIIQTIINGFGTDAIAGMTVFARIEGFLYYPAFSFGMAVTSFISQNLGAEKPERIREGLKVSLLAAGIFTMGAAVLLMGLADPILLWFTDSVAVIANGKQAMMTIFPFYFLYAISQVMIGAIRGYQKTVFPMIASMIAYCLFRVVFCMMLSSQYHDLWVVYYSYNLSFLLLLGMLVDGYRRLCKPVNKKIVTSNPDFR